MKKPLSLLAASAALVVAIGLTAWSAMGMSAGASSFCGTGICAAAFGDARRKPPLIRVGDDGDEMRHEMRRGPDDDDDEDCEDDDDRARGGAHGNPARAGSAPPPANGLFANGVPPVAVTK